MKLKSQGQGQKEGVAGPTGQPGPALLEGITAWSLRKRFNPQELPSASLVFNRINIVIQCSGG